MNPCPYCYKPTNTKCCHNCRKDANTCEVIHECGKDCRGHESYSNADRIRVMSDEELANFLLNLAYAGSDPWAELFARKFCDNCPTVECRIQETGQTMYCHECDFADGKCPHGTDVTWWLQQPAEV